MSARSITRQPSGQRKSETRFQRLWVKSEKLREDNLQLESELGKLVQRIESEILVAERDLGEAVRAAVFHQLDFAQKKSLLKWQRMELGYWIDEHLEFLSNSGLLDESLQNKLAETSAVELGISLDPESGLSPAEQLNEYFEAQEARLAEQADLSDAVESGDSTQDDLLGGVDELLGLDSEELDEIELIELLRRIEQDQYDQPPFESTDRIESSSKPISDQVFKRLFRQTAAALHPDRESDAARQREKHELMSELLKARKEFDLMTMLRLHEEYANADSELGVDDQNELEQVLHEYIAQQQQRQQEIIHQTPFHYLAYRDFYSKNAATVTRKINAHIKTIDRQRCDLIDFVENVKTLKKLKEWLEKRYDSDPLRDIRF